MKYSRILISELGDPEVMRIVTEDLRDPAPNEVRVRTLAAGVAWADCMMRRGSYPAQPKLPFTPGYDVVGVVDRCGPGANIPPGEMVAALMIHGAYSEYVFLPQSELVPVPAGLDPAEAVCLVLNYVTAWQMLHRRAQVKSGDAILVHSAAGGVGTALLELGRLAGLKMLGTASAPKHVLVASYGCEPIDYRAVDFVERLRQLQPAGVDFVFDPIGGWHWLQSGRCLKTGGKVIAFGSQAALSATIKDRLADGFAAARLILRNRFTFYTITSEKKKHPQHFRDDLATLLEKLARQEIHPVIADRLPWQQAVEAHRRLEKGRVEGKLVLIFA